MFFFTVVSLTRIEHTLCDGVLHVRECFLEILHIGLLLC